MRHQAIFERQKLLARVALVQELQACCWQPPVNGPLQCPHCGSAAVSQILSKRPGRTHSCHDCKQKFSLEEVPGCTCWYPGKLLKCQDCPHYQRLAAGVKRRLAGELKAMTVAEAEAFLAQPNEEPTAPQLAAEPSPQTPAAAEPQTAVAAESSADGQLSFFDQL